MTSKAVAKKSPDQMVEEFAKEFARVLPPQISSSQFCRIATGALRRDEMLMKAAAMNPLSLMHALLEAARLGLEPGTNEYHLTPRFGKTPGVVGIVGYRGHIKRMINSGLVSGVVAQLVHETDKFEYQPGWDRPVHTVPDWFAPRGEVKGAYAYAVMKDGSISSVSIIGPDDIRAAMDASASADKGGPWKTHYGRMVLKTAVRRLEAWVPSSSTPLEIRMAAIASETPSHAPATVTATQVATVIPDDEPMPPPPWVDADGVIDIEAESYDVEDPA